MSEKYEVVTKVSTGVVHLSDPMDSGFSTLCGVYMGVGLHADPKFIYQDDWVNRKVAYATATCRTCKRVADSDQYLYDKYQEKLAAGLVEE